MSKPIGVNFARYWVALASVALAIGARLLLDPALGLQFPFATVFFAVLVTAWYGGSRPAAVAVVLGALASDFFLLPPRGSFQLAGLDEQVGLALFVFTSLGIALLAGKLHTARERAECSANSVRHHASADRSNLRRRACVGMEWADFFLESRRGAPLRFLARRSNGEDQPRSAAHQRAGRRGRLSRGPGARGRMGRRVAAYRPGRPHHYRGHSHGADPRAGTRLCDRNQPRYHGT